MAGKSVYMAAPGSGSGSGSVAPAKPKDSNFVDSNLRNFNYCEEYDPLGGGIQEESYLPYKSGPAPPTKSSTPSESAQAKKAAPGVSCYMAAPGQ